jgi:hypothetical protein
MKFTQQMHNPKILLHAKIQENFSRNVGIILLLLAKNPFVCPKVSCLFALKSLIQPVK